MEVVEVDIDAAKDVGMNTIEGAGADSEENVTASRSRKGLRYS